MPPPTDDTDRMAALGRRTRGVACDLNNLLTVINGSAELVLASLREDDPVRGLVEDIRRAGERAAALLVRVVREPDFVVGDGALAGEQV